MEQCSSSVVSFQQHSQYYTRDKSSNIMKQQINNHKTNLNYFMLYINREILKETMAADEEYEREQWTMFGNEAERVEIDVIRNQQLLRTRVNKIALRKQVQSSICLKNPIILFIKRLQNCLDISISGKKKCHSLTTLNKYSFSDW